MNKASGIFISLALLFVILALISGSLELWHPSGLSLIPARRYYLIPALFLLVIGTSLIKFKLTEYTPNLYVFSLGLLFLFISTWIYNDYGVIKAPSDRGLILLFTFVSILIFYKFKKINWSLVSLSALTLLVACFLIEANAHPLSSDDHMTFLHRLILLKDNFPNIPIYDPLWNAGYDQRYFFATGALNFYFLTLPLTIFFDPVQVYNFCVAFVSLILPFFSIYFSARILKLSVNTAWIAALLSLIPCLEWIRWCYAYGTMGFITSTALLPLVLSLSIRILDTKENFNFFYALLLIVTFSLMLLWSASGLVFIPLILMAFIKFFSSKLLKQNYVKFVIIALLIINLPWISVFWSVSSVGNFMNSEASLESSEGLRDVNTYKKETKKKRYKHKSAEIDFKQSLNEGRGAFSKFNPLILIFALPGILLLPAAYRLGFILVSAWLFIMGVFLFQLKPQLELDRMLVILSVILTLPTALAVNTLFKKDNIKNFFHWLTTAFIAAFLIAGPVSASSLIRRRSIINYSFQGEITEDLTAILKKYQEQGRVLFSGCILHEIDGGHLAPLTELSGTPIIASSPVHNLWWYKQVFPEEYMAKKHEGIVNYLNNNNVVAILAHEPTWRKYFLEKPEEFKLVTKIKRFYVFERINYQSNYFYTGSGKLLNQNNSSVTLQIDTVNPIIKFNYYPFLESDKCELTSHKISDNLTLTKVTKCKPGSILTIKSKSAWKRIDLF